MSRVWIVACCLAWLHLVLAYKQGDTVPIYYNKIFSLKNQLTYSYQSLSFICPLQQESRKKSGLVFDQDLRGDRRVQSDYKLNFLENQECKLLCKQSWSIADAIKAEELIADEYLAEWELDGMPGATVSYTNEAPEHNYRVGFPLGFKKTDLTFINNHVIFQIFYSVDQKNPGNYDIVGFEVYPDSIADGECTKKDIEYEYQEVTGRKTTVAFTYSVLWKEIGTIQNRWDAFLMKPNPDRHYFSLLNGFIVVLLMFAIIAVILVKTFHKENSAEDKDFKVYEDADDFIGWRLINRDVFRRPVYGGLLTPLMGSGIQLIIVSIGLIGCLYMGWYHPAKPGSLTRWFTIFFLLGSLPAGYSSARMYKVFRGKSWILNGILTAIVAPGALLLILFIVSMIAWTQQSSLAISFSGWTSLVSLWLFVSLPLTCVGAFIGEKCERIEHPSRTTQIPRMIPAKRWHQLHTIRFLLSGVIPFATIFLNWHEFLRSASKGEYILSAQYTLIASILFFVAVFEITIVSIFLQLCAEDYLWWWQSFMIGASPALYMFTYGVYYFIHDTYIDGMVGGSIYILNLLFGCALVGLCTGTLGFLSAHVFIRRIYSSVKVD